MQVLGARLTLEEQRINTLGRELTDVQNEIASTIRERQDTEAGLKQTEESIARGTVPIERQKDIDFMLADMKKLLSQRQELEQQLRAKESDVSGLIASEQGRWADFNERLDKLEQSLSRAVPTR